MTADSVPAPMVFPTTPGSVIEATIEGLVEKRLWMLDFGGYWTNNYAGTAMKPVTSAQLTLVRVLFDAATPAASDEDAPISADHLRRAVLQWASRFIPGDRWDTEDVRDLETALGGTVENRCHHRSFDAASVPAADILALAEKWHPGTPGPRRMTSWARLAYQDCARELRALVDERQPQRCEHGILRRLDCFECNEVAAAEQADKGEAADTPREGFDRCTTPGCDGLANYSAPGKGHIAGCRYPFDAPAAPMGEPLPEGWHHIPWTSKEDGVGAPETPASGESGPPASPALCVGCGHDVGLHNEKGCLHGWARPEGLCRCRLDGSQAPRVPVNDEAQAAWQAIQPAWFGDSETAFEAGFRAARGEDA